MALATVTVTGILHRPTGDPVAAARVRAELTQQEVDDGIVVPTAVETITAADGTFALELWPNARGQAGSQYRIAAAQARTSLLDVLITVPDVEVPVAIETIINQPPYPPIPAAQAAQQAAQEAALAASQSADSAAEDAESADESAGQAQQAAGQAQGYAQAAGEAAGEAIGAAGTATGQAGIASGAANTATGAATSAGESAGIAHARAQTAISAAGVAEGARDESVSARDEAVDAAAGVVLDRWQIRENGRRALREKYGSGPYPAVDFDFRGGDF